MNHLMDFQKVNIQTRVSINKIIEAAPDLMHGEQWDGIQDLKFKFVRMVK